VEQEYATIATTSIAPLRAAILGEHCKPDDSKSIRQGAERLSSTCKNAECLLSVSEAMTEFG
jgi:hypothetical protein